MANPDDLPENYLRITDPVISKRVVELIGEGPIYLRHAFYNGGGSPDWFTITKHDQFVEHAARSKPGDWFYVWSIPDLITRTQHFLHRKYDKYSPLSKEAKDMFADVRNFLKKGRELFLVFMPFKSEDTEADFNDIDGYEGFLEKANKFAGQRLEIYGFDMDTLWKPDNILINAKLPNSSGKIPQGGSY